MMRKIFVLMVLTCFLWSCGGSKRASKKRTYRPRVARTVTPDREKPAETSKQTEIAAETRSYDGVEGYINAYAEIAKEEMRQYKIPASITLAQAVLESGAGRGSLTQKANNHFGIKCHDWEGESVYHDDDAKGECFRKYKDPMYSFRDHSLFLTGRKRYAELFELEPDDYEGWAKGLRKAGYATDRKYPEKLIGIVERYQLYVFDSEVLGSSPRKYEERSTTVVNLHTVKKGETLFGISRLYNITVDEIKSNNKLKGDNLNVGQQLNVTPQYNGF